MRLPQLNRRQMLLGGAAICAAGGGKAAADEAADAEFRALVDRLADRPARTRPFLLRRFDATRLTAAGRILYDAVLPGAEADAALAERAWGENGLPYAVTHRNGAYRQVAALTSEDDPRRLVRAVTRDTNRLEGAAARGVIAPDFLIDATIPPVEAARAHAAGLEGARHEQLTQALARQVETLQALRARAGPDAGVWRLEDGETFVAQALQFHLGAPVDAHAAHARALARCHELQAEADELLRAQGLSEGSVGERLRQVLQDPTRLTGANPESKGEAIAAMTAQLERVRGLMGAAIENVSEAPATVRLLPAELEAAGTQGRRQGSVYYVDLGAPRPLWSLASVVHHELIPGHILQAPYERAAAPAALQLRYAGGYGEGWPIYAEQLADEMGAFAEDPLARLGYLQWMLFRMARVVADTGIHALRWSRERAVEEMRALQGDSIAFVSIEDDVVRFCAQRGVHAAQGLAALHIAELRERTRRDAGQSFSLARFHDAMLRHGPLPPPGLDQAARAAFGA